MWPRDGTRRSHWAVGTGHTSFSQTGTSPFWCFLQVQGRQGLSGCGGAEMPREAQSPVAPCSAMREVPTPCRRSMVLGTVQPSLGGHPGKTGCGNHPSVSSPWSKLCLPHWGIGTDSDISPDGFGPQVDLLLTWGAFCGVSTALVQRVSYPGRK